MLEIEFQQVYDVFKERFYHSLCTQELSMLEAFSLDVIYMLKNPTIVEYANYMQISQPNATYKINQLIEKGYLIKKTSEEDKRVAHLEVTEKFKECYRENDATIQAVMGHISATFTEEEVKLLEKMLQKVRLDMEKQHD